MCDSETEEGEMTVRLSAASNSPRSLHCGAAHGIPEWNLVYCARDLVTVVHRTVHLGDPPVRTVLCLAPDYRPRAFRLHGTAHSDRGNEATYVETADSLLTEPRERG
jgi:hypothetical protein